MPIAPPSRRWWKTAGGIVGFLILAAAVGAVLSQADAASRAWTALRAAPAGRVALLALLPAINLVLVSSSFWILTTRVGKVGPGEMLALIASAWLLNYLPVRPGVFGRVAYHKAVNAIPIRDSALVVAANIASGLVALALLGVGVAALGRDLPVWAPALPVATCLVVSFVPTRSPWTRVFALSCAFRAADSCVWIARYWLAFSLVGTPISVPEATALSIVAQAAMLVPIVGNGLGLREWAVALVAGALPAWSAGASVAAAPVTPGLSADLLNRAVELAIALPVGLTACAWVARRLARHRPVSPDLPGTPA
jgi:uncharacterized membrane protein YbhN (UPF0104 family)